jgi:predicted HTH domain antitoxin
VASVVLLDTAVLTYSDLMNLSVTLPDDLADAAQLSQGAFAREAQLAMAAKLYEMGRLSSGLAARVAGLPRSVFLWELSKFNVPLIDLDAADLTNDLANA